MTLQRVALAAAIVIVLAFGVWLLFTPRVIPLYGCNQGPALPSGQYYVDDYCSSVELP